MPVYEYRCSDCEHQFAALNSLKNYQMPASCPVCSGTSPRIIGTAPKLNTMNPGRRNAFQVNEKSANEPGVRNRHTCGSSCGCDSTKNNATTGHQETTTPKLKQQNGKRPWMLGH